jgi:hypothetical protein
MEDTPEKLELNVKQSSRLLRLGLEPVRAKFEAAKKNRSDILLDMLKLKLPVNPDLYELLPAVLKPLSEELESISGLPLGKLLLEPQTKTELLKSVKDYAKQLGAAATDDIERDAALAIYFAAIAAALVFQNVRISQYSYEQLEQSFKTLCKNDWISSELAGLYQKAIDYCSRKKR